MNPGIIHINWEGPLTCAVSSKLLKEDQDRGIYQIYGRHVVLGASVLLYIGKAVHQPFGKRIRQHRFMDWTPDSRRVEIYVGRLLGRDPGLGDLDLDIERVEALLIYTHNPLKNSTGNLA